MLERTDLREATGQLKLQQAYQHYCSSSISEHIDTFIHINTFHINVKMERAVRDWLRLHGPELL